MSVRGISPPPLHSSFIFVAFSNVSFSLNAVFVIDISSSYINFLSCIFRYCLTQICKSLDLYVNCFSIETSVWGVLTIDMGFVFLTFILKSNIVFMEH